MWVSRGGVSSRYRILGAISAEGFDAGLIAEDHESVTIAVSADEAWALESAPLPAVRTCLQPGCDCVLGVDVESEYCSQHRASLRYPPKLRDVVEVVRSWDVVRGVVVRVGEDVVRDGFEIVAAGDRRVPIGWREAWRVVERDLKPGLHDLVEVRRLGGVVIRGVVVTTSVSHSEGDVVVQDGFEILAIPEDCCRRPVLVGWGESWRIVELASEGGHEQPNDREGEPSYKICAVPGCGVVLSVSRESRLCPSCDRKVAPRKCARRGCF